MSVLNKCRRFKMIKPCEVKAKAQRLEEQNYKFKTNMQRCVPLFLKYLNGWKWCTDFGTGDEWGFKWQTTVASLIDMYNIASLFNRQVIRRRHGSAKSLDPYGNVTKLCHNVIDFGHRAVAVQNETINSPLSIAAHYSWHWDQVHRHTFARQSQLARRTWSDKTRRFLCNYPLFVTVMTFTMIYFDSVII